MGPRVEPLEGRALLSTADPGAVVVPTALVRGVEYLFLNGSAHGTVQHKHGNPDTGAIVELHGSGRLTPLGKLSHLSGTLVGTGFIQEGHAGGTILLSNARGSVTLSLVGPLQGGFTAPSSGTYHFTVAKGTGAYAHDVGTGTVDLTLGAQSFTMTFHGEPNRF
jgi:hypothetical protein